MKVLVAGAGAIGQWLGSRLADAGHDVTLFTTPRHADAIAQGGLVVHGRSRFEGPIRTRSDLERPGHGYDHVVLTAKAHLTAALVPRLVPVLAEDGVLTSLQNGLGNAQKLLRHLPAPRVAVALTSHGVTLERPGRVHHAGTGPTFVGPARSGHREAAAAAGRVHDLLAEAGIAPTLEDDMRPLVWRKAVVNAGINPVGALADVPNGELRGDAWWPLVAGLVREAEGLARAARVELPPGDLVATARETLDKTADNRCSMLQDVQQRRPTEVEQITGRLVRLGERLLVPMQRSDSVYGRIKDLEASYMGAQAATKMAWDELPWEAEPF